MRPDDFFTEELISEPWGTPWVQRSVNESTLALLNTGRLPERSDVEAAVALARLIHDDLGKFGTGGGQELTEAQIRLALRGLSKTLERMGAADFEPPFRDFASVRNWWIQQGASGSGGWQARRELLETLFNPLHDRLADLQAGSLTRQVAQPVSPPARTGLATVDTEVSDLRQQFQNATSAQGYSAVGLGAVRVTEALSRALRRSRPPSTRGDRTSVRQDQDEAGAVRRRCGPGQRQRRTAQAAPGRHRVRTGHQAQSDAHAS